jgi:hypothetical protein
MFRWHPSETQKLTTAISAPRIKGVKRHVADLPLELILRAAQSATQGAAIDAVNAGRIVTGWKDGALVHYGVGARPLVLKMCADESCTVRIPYGN